MRRLCSWLVLMLLLGCSAPSGPAVATVNAAGLTLRPDQSPRTITWADIEGMQVTGHLLSAEGEKVAPILSVIEKGRPVEVCSAYPHRVDPKSYAGLHDAISVNQGDFAKLRQAIASGAGLVPVPQAEGVWQKKGASSQVTEAEFRHAYTGLD